MATTESLVARLDECGLMLQHDYALPSLVTIVVGEPVRGSWWSHPRAHAIFECLNDLTAHPDVLTAKLVSGKVTLIHRRLWPALLAVASAHEPWQFAGLPAAAHDLYQSVELYGMLMASGRNAKQLEQRLLVHSAQVHTEAGRHETRLERWSLWAERSGCQNLPAANEGQRQIEVATLGLGGAVRLLPWHRVRPI